MKKQLGFRSAVITVTGNCFDVAMLRRQWALIKTTGQVALKLHGGCLKTRYFIYGLIRSRRSAGTRSTSSSSGQCLSGVDGNNTHLVAVTNTFVPRRLCDKFVGQNGYSARRHMGWQRYSWHGIRYLGKIESPSSSPLVLKYHERHYSAFRHSGNTNQLPNFEMKENMQATCAQDRQEHIYGTTEVLAEGVDEPFQQMCYSVAASSLDCSGMFPMLVADTKRQEKSRALVTLERQLVTLPRLLPSAPVLDRKRGYESLSEQAETRKAQASHLPDTTF
uniref:Uncharacterized protein n=1 Tax=Hyaloperonospora arabidopsidis (strain Emoy2) TaxID=559515 RepID=M4BL41_HYAAE